jgi:hypothetical protein
MFCIDRMNVSRAIKAKTEHRIELAMIHVHIARRRSKLIEMDLSWYHSEKKLGWEGDQL